MTITGSILDSQVSVTASTTSSVVRERFDYVDVFRGLLIAHMALDHASLMFNVARPAEEVAALPPPVSADMLQFLTRFSGVPVAPGFLFVAGFMVALTSAARERRGQSHAEVTRRLLRRALLLLLVDGIIMGLPRAAAGFYSFMVLSSAGVSIALLALVRSWPTRVLLPLALAILLFHPLIDLEGLPVLLRAVLYEPVRSGPIRSLYPVLPWAGVALLGFVVGRDALTRREPTRFWLTAAALSLLFFLVVRVWNGYGNAFPHSGMGSADFWVFSKYPPDLPFLSWALIWVFLGLAGTRRLTRDGTPALLKPFASFGRVPLFFYVTHFYVLGVAIAIARTKVGLASTYAIWLALLVAMMWPTTRYFAWQRSRPSARGKVGAHDQSLPPRA